MMAVLFFIYEHNLVMLILGAPPMKILNRYILENLMLMNIQFFISIPSIVYHLISALDIEPVPKICVASTIGQFTF